MRLVMELVIYGHNLHLNHILYNERQTFYIKEIVDYYSHCMACIAVSHLSDNLDKADNRLAYGSRCCVGIRQDNHWC